MLTAHPTPRVEQRSDSRSDWNEQVSVRTCAGVLMDGRTLDISSSGIGIEPAAALRSGEVVTVMLTPRGASVRVPLLAEVMWCRNDGGRRRAGLRLLA